MDLVEQRQADKKEFKRHPWEMARFRILDFFVHKHHLSKKFILDVGSGDAFVSGRLAEKYPGTIINAVDVNYDDNFINAHKHIPVRFIRSLQETERGKIDLVLLMDVIEHIENPGKLTSELKLLKGVDHSTSFFITVPAFQSLFTGHDVFLGHYRRYTRRGLTRFMKEQGFEIKESGYFFFSLLLVRCFQKFSGQKNINALHNWKGKAWKTSLISSFLWADFKISWYLSRPGIQLPGLSCYCICNPLP